MISRFELKTQESNLKRQLKSIQDIKLTQLFCHMEIGYRQIFFAFESLS